MKHFFMLSTLAILLSSSFALHATSQELQGIQSQEVKKDVVIHPNVCHFLTQEDFQAILPHIHGLCVNTAEPFYLEEQTLSLERLSKAQSEGWLGFHMAQDRALAFAKAHWDLAITFTWPKDAVLILDLAYEALSNTCERSSP